MSKQQAATDRADTGHDAAESGEVHTPYVSPNESPREFTVKAIIFGIIFGIAFGAANAYLGLQAGLTISTSIPVAVMTVAAFRGLNRVGLRSTILEANLAQTVGSASSSVASGVIFTLPALFMWGLSPKLLQMTLLALCGGLLGVLFMVPLRQFLIAKEHRKLPYPEGTACAEVLVASEVGGGRAANVFVGLGVGALIKFVFAWLKPFPSTLKLAVPIIPKAELGLKFSSALLGVGYILGPKIGAVMVGGALLSSLVLIPAIAIWGAGRSEPLYPETIQLIADMTPGSIWNRYIRYVGAGAVATAGLITLIRSIPTMVESFRIGMKQWSASRDNAGHVVARTSRDLSLGTVGKLIGVTALAMALIPQIFGPLESMAVRTCAAVLVVIFAFFFVTVASRIVGLVGVTSNPTSGMTIASLIGTSTVFLLLGWTDQAGMAAALMVGCVVAIAASIAGDTSQDLKTGFLLGATPRSQQIGELVGVLTSAVFVCLTLLLLDTAYGFGSETLPAPQATLMKVVIEGVLQAQLPWSLIAIGAAIACVAEVMRIPSLPFAVGVYLPVSTLTPIFLGGVLRWLVERRAPSEESAGKRRASGVLFGSGLVGGEGLMGVGIAGVVCFVIMTTPEGAEVRSLPYYIGTQWTSASMAMWAGAAFFALLLAYFARRCRAQE